MPTTSNFGWTTPADTDLVKDGAAAIRTLGNGIDTSLLDLKGGTTGQILSKASNTDLDYTWIANDQGDITAVQAGVGISVASGTGPIPVITNSSTDLITTAGDILYGTAADTVARLGIGTAGQVLKVNSGATAPEWGSASAAFVGVSTYKSTTAQSIANDTEVVITFNTEEFDTNGFHDNSTNNSRLTIPSGRGGYYLLVGNIRFASNATGNRFVGFLKNGTTSVARMNRFDANAGSTTFVGATALVSAVAGDYFEFRAYQNSGGNLNIEADQADTRFGCYFLGA